MVHTWVAVRLVEGFTLIDIGEYLKIFLIPCGSLIFDSAEELRCLSPLQGDPIWALLAGEENGNASHASRGRISSRSSHCQLLWPE